MSMAEYILKLRGYIKRTLRQKQDVRLIAYFLAAPKEPITQWMPNPLDGIESDEFDVNEMIEAWNIAQNRHDQRAEDKD